MRIFKKPEFICTKCGLCCRIAGLIYPDLDNGEGICKFYDPETKLCTIYEDRPGYCRVVDSKPPDMSMEDWLNLNYKVCKILQDEIT